MTPPLTKEQTEYINDLYYNKKFYFGRDKLWNYIKENNPDIKISRRQVAEFLKYQQVNQLHQNTKKPKDFKSTVIENPHQIIAIDLTDMRNIERDNYKWLLNGIDMSSRFFYSTALKDKTQDEVLKGFKKMMKKIKRVGAIRSDNGSEFINKKFKDYLETKGIKQILSEAQKPQSNGMIERANRTFKTLLNKTMNINPDFKWYQEKNLNELVNNINNTISTGMDFTPQEIEEAYEEKNTEKLIQSYKNDLKKKNKNLNEQKFIIGDRVRIYQPSDKEKSKKWSEEEYVIEKIYKPKKLNTVYEYKVKGFSDKFKEEELQKIPLSTQNKIKKTEKFIVSKLLNPQIKNNKPHYEVQWKGYKKSDNTIEPREQLLIDVPKLVRKYERENKIYFYKRKNNGRWDISKDGEKEK